MTKKLPPRLPSHQRLAIFRSIVGTCKSRSRSGQRSPVMIFYCGRVQRGIYWCLLRVTTLDCWQLCEPGAWMVLSKLYHNGINNCLPSMPLWRASWCQQSIVYVRVKTLERTKVHRHTKTPLEIFTVPDRRFDHVHVDIVGSLPPSRGFSYLLTVMDRFTRWPEVVPLTNTSADTVCRAFLSTWVARFGIPSIVTTDQGRQFQSALWRELTTALGIKLAPASAYHPQTNGM
ncbi:Retrovirus-related Pol polyprotein from transposon, partial [Trichinella patagoniensis]